MPSFSTVFPQSRIGAAIEQRDVRHAERESLLLGSSSSTAAVLRPDEQGLLPCSFARGTPAGWRVRDR